MKSKAKPYRKKVVTSSKPKRNKKAGGSRRSSNAGVYGTAKKASSRNDAVVVDLVHKEEQRTALYTELALQPPASIGKRLKCRMGAHGDTARPVITVWIDGEGNRRQKHSYIEEYFCVSCGREWHESPNGTRS